MHAAHIHEQTLDELHGSECNFHEKLKLDNIRMLLESAFDGKNEWMTVKSGFVEVLMLLDPTYEISHPIYRSGITDLLVLDITHALPVITIVCLWCGGSASQTHPFILHTWFVCVVTALMGRWSVTNRWYWMR